MPTTTHIVDLREEFKAGNKSIFSRLLMRKMKDALAAKKQIILFLNKRGFSSSLTCRQCGFTMKCPNCDVSLTYHKESERKMYMLCHYCGVKQKIPHTCPRCNSLYIRFFGIGTQKIEEMIKDLFPKAHIARADRDTTANKSSFEKIYADFKNGTTNILVGTQIIAKGLDIENVGLIGVVLADIGFHIPDFRASERVFQLLTQVSGRTGRLGTSGEVIIQTYLPDHPAIRFASEENYKDFYASEIEDRKEYNYPPFSKIIKLIYVHKDQRKCLSAAEHLYKEFCWMLEHKEELQQNKIEIFLTPPLISKLHNKYHYHIILKGKNPSTMLSYATLNKGWKIDIDPVAIV